MGLVLEGRVDILSTDYWGSETLMARLGPGELFGEVFAGQGVELPYDPVSYTHLEASRTARGFFERRGYQVAAAQLVPVDGEELENFRMAKKLCRTVSHETNA